jgi:hypothetical protein
MEDKNPERKIYLTGKTPEKIRDNPKWCCYICKREEGDDSAFFENGNVDVIPEMKLSWYVVKLARFELHYLLCIDCFLLMDNFRNTVEEAVDARITDCLKPSQC